MLYFRFERVHPLLVSRCSNDVTRSEMKNRLKIIIIFKLIRFFRKSAPDPVPAKEKPKNRFILPRTNNSMSATHSVPHQFTYLSIRLFTFIKTFSKALVHSFTNWIIQSNSLIHSNIHWKELL